MGRLLHNDIECVSHFETYVYATVSPEVSLIGPTTNFRCILRRHMCDDPSTNLSRTLSCMQFSWFFTGRITCRYTSRTGR